MDTASVRENPPPKNSLIRYNTSSFGAFVTESFLWLFWLVHLMSGIWNLFLWFSCGKWRMNHGERLKMLILHFMYVAFDLQRVQSSVYPQSCKNYKYWSRCIRIIHHRASWFFSTHNATNYSCIEYSCEVGWWCSHILPYVSSPFVNYWSTYPHLKLYPFEIRV